MNDQKKQQKNNTMLNNRIELLTLVLLALRSKPTELIELCNILIDKNLKKNTRRHNILNAKSSKSPSRRLLKTVQTHRHDYFVYI